MGSENGFRFSEGEKPRVESYRDLIAWKRAMALAKMIYALTRTFPREEIYGLTSQLRRASVSVAANLAEGRSRGFRKEFAYFVGIAKGSLAEVQTLLWLAKEVGFSETSLFDVALTESEAIERLLTRLFQSLSPKTDSRFPNRKE